MKKIQKKQVFMKNKYARGSLDLREWMAINSITQQQLADELGLSVTAVHNWVNGKIPSQFIKLRMLEKLTEEQVLLKNIVENHEENQKRKDKKKEKNKNKE
jgi:transcriptional regulator with XRE-family HTH domain